MQDGTENTNGTKNGGIDSLTQETISQEPRIDEEVIANLEEREKARQESTSVEDTNSAKPETNAAEPSKPEAFDPAIHCSDSNGNPVLKKDGTFRRKPGRKSGTNTNPASGASPNPASGVNTPPIDYSSMAHGFLGLAFTGAQMFLGQHWEPTKTEYEMIHSQAVRCMQFYDMPEVPPAVALLGAVAMYAGPRYLDQRTHQYIHERKQVKNSANQDTK